MKPKKKKKKPKQEDYIKLYNKWWELEYITKPSLPKVILTNITE